MMKTLKYRLLIGLALAAALTAGCGRPTPTPVPPPTQTVIAEATATHESLPSLLSTGAYKKIQVLLATNGGCELPCWWGITPGITTWNEVMNKLEPIAWKISDFKDHPIYKDRVTREFYFAMDDQPTLINSIMVNFVLDKKTLEIDWIVSSQTYNLQSILNSYGAPDTILINIAGLPPPGPASYDYNLVYSKNGIIAGGGRDASVINHDGEDFVQICQTDFLSDARGLVLWDPKKELEFKDVFIQFESVDDYVPLDKAIGMTTKEFSELILENNASSCLEIPMSKWVK